MSSEKEQGARLANSFAPLLCRFDKNYSDLAKRNGESYFGMWVLEEIGEHPEGITQKQLCEATHLPKQTVNSIVSSCVKRGLAKTMPNAQDGRSKLHVLTEAGMVKFRAICKDEEWLYSFAAKRASKEEVDAVLEVLDRLASRFEEGIRLLAEEDRPDGEGHDSPSASKPGKGERQ